MPDLTIYTDGACSGNPGPGGWGALMIATNGDTVLKERTLCGGEADTTNNRMELMAAIESLNALDRPSTLTLITDSAYVKGGITGWMFGWKKNGWKTSARSRSRMLICGNCWTKPKRVIRSLGSGSKATLVIRVMNARMN